eukprot:767636-Hanusia_phi.AAC.2
MPISNAMILAVSLCPFQRTSYLRATLPPCPLQVRAEHVVDLLVRFLQALTPRFSTSSSSYLMLHHHLAKELRLLPSSQPSKQHHLHPPPLTAPSPSMGSPCVLGTFLQDSILSGHVAPGVWLPEASMLEPQTASGCALLEALQTSRKVGSRTCRRTYMSATRAQTRVVVFGSRCFPSSCLSSPHLTCSCTKANKQASHPLGMAAAIVFGGPCGNRSVG